MLNIKTFEENGKLERFIIGAETIERLILLCL